MNLPEPQSLTDAEVAASFGEVIRGRFLYCAPLGGWHSWDGVRWRRDSAEKVYEHARRYVIDLGKQLLESDEEGQRAKKAIGYRHKSRIDAIVTIARRLDGIAADAAEFDRHPDLLCCTNGVVDLRTGEISTHDPQLRLTTTTGVSYDPNAVHGDVNKVLEIVEDDVRDYLQAAIGYAATGHVSEDLLLVLDGKGSNGKTTLLGAISAALGEYASAAPQRLLMKSGSEEHPTLYAQLHGKRLVTVEETAEGGALRVEQMKALTGGSSITARFIAKDYFEFRPTHQLVIATNHRPIVNSTEHATWRRLRCVPFPHRYERPDRLRPGDRAIDLQLRSRLTLPDRMEAMLAWIVAGAVRWHQEGLPTCPTIEQETEEWRRSEDVILRFATDRVIFDPNATSTLERVYMSYVSWCDQEGRPSSSKKNFGALLEKHDLVDQHHVHKQKKNTGWVWEGVTLRPW